MLTFDMRIELAARKQIVNFGARSLASFVVLTFVSILYR